MGSNITVRPYRQGEEVYIANAHERVYLEEYNWGPAFGDYAKKIAIDFAASPKNPREEMWVAEADGELCGCVMLVETADPDVGQIRLFLVEKVHRKNGVGTKLTDALMAKAQACGYHTLTLWTADVLESALRHYAKLGFACVERTPNDSWSLSGARVYEEKWEMRL